MKNLTYKIKAKLVFAILVSGLIFFSCENYLDQSPEAAIKQEQIFKDFTSFQGFVEDLYNDIIDIGTASDPNLADESRMNVTFFINEGFDNGNFWSWPSGWASHFGRNLGTSGRGTWYNSWFGIRKANLGLANMEKLVNATQEE